MKNQLVFALLLLCSITLHAQNYQVSGTVVDSASGEALVGANVALTSAYDTSKVYGAATDVDGKFSIEVPAAAYRLRLTFVGYAEYSKRIFVQKDMELGMLSVAEAAISTEDVYVEGKTPPAVMKGDTVEYNAKAFKTNPDATAEDLVKKMPGISTENGKVTAQGEEVKSVVVDGKRFFGDDAKTTLKNIPSEMVDKVQVYDQKSDQSQFSGFDDGEDSKTINIISKPEFKKGTFGRVYAGAGHDDELPPGGERYNLGGVLNTFKGDRRITLLGQFNNINEQNFSSQDLAGVMSGGGGRGRGWGRGGSNVGEFLVDDQGGITATNAAGINYIDQWGKKVEVSGSYFFNYTDNQQYQSLYQQYISSRDSGQIYEETEENRSQNMNHRANLRLEYKINDKNSLLIQPQFNMQMNEGASLLNGQAFNPEAILSSTSSDFNSSVQAWNFSNRILFRHRFEKRGRTISFGANQQLRNNTAESSLLSTNNFFTQGIADSLDQNAKLDQYERTFSGRIEYTEPLGKKMQLQLRYDPSFSLNDADKTTNSFSEVTNSYSDLDTLLSSVAENTYMTQQGGAGIRFFNKKVMLMARANFQWAQLSTQQTFPGQLDTSYNFYSVLPFAVMRLNISKTKKLRLFYRSNTDEPSIAQLQEVLDNNNPLQLSIGNAALQQSFNHRMYLHYVNTNLEKNSMFFSMLSVNYTSNYIGDNNFIAFQDTVYNGIALARGTQLTQPVNLDQSVNIRTYSSYGFPLEFIKCNLKLNLSASYRRTPGMINGELNYSNTPNGGLGVTISSNISEKLDFTLTSNSSYNYNFNTLNTRQNNQFFNQRTDLRFYWNPWKTLVFRSDVNHQFFSGLSDGFNTNFVLWNASIATKLFKNKQGELSLMMYDILGQNNSIARNFTEIYIEDVRTNVLQRYLMLQFTYKFRPKNSNVDEGDVKDVERYRQYRKYHK